MMIGKHKEKVGWTSSWTRRRTKSKYCVIKSWTKMTSFFWATASSWSLHTITGPPHLNVFVISLWHCGKPDACIVYNGVTSICLYWSLDWIEQCLTSPQHSIGYLGDSFTGQKTRPTASKYWR